MWALQSSGLWHCPSGIQGRHKLLEAVRVQGKPLHKHSAVIQCFVNALQLNGLRCPPSEASVTMERDCVGTESCQRGKGTPLGGVVPCMENTLQGGLLNLRAALRVMVMMSRDASLLLKSFLIAYCLLG